MEDEVDTTSSDQPTTDTASTPTETSYALSDSKASAPLKALSTVTKTLTNSRKAMSFNNNSINLAGTLKRLSGVVQHMRSEKMATNLTKLVSMTHLGNGRSTLSAMFLKRKRSTITSTPSSVEGSSNSNNIISKTTSTTGNMHLSEEEDFQTLFLSSIVRETMQLTLEGLATIYGAPLSTGRGSDDEGSTFFSTPTKASSSSTTTLPSTNSSSGSSSSCSTRLSIEQFFRVMKFFQTCDDETSMQIGKYPLSPPLSPQHADALKSTSLPPAPPPTPAAPHSSSSSSCLYSPAPPSSSTKVPQSAPGQLSIGELVFARFIDRDGDGFISMDDVLAVQAMVLQRSREFIKVIFRVYVEAVWYPGRQVNLVNHLKYAPTRVNLTAQESESEERSNSSTRNINSNKLMNNHLDVVEPPKHITARHVAAIFARYGYLSSDGSQVFSVLHAALTKKKGLDLKDYLEDGEDRNHSVGDDCSSDTSSTRSSTKRRSSAREGSSTAELISSMKTTTLSGSESATTALDGVGSGASGGSKGKEAEVVSSNAKMDIEDFCQACELDDVLLQVLFLTSRRKISSVIKMAESQFYQEQERLSELSQETREDAPTPDVPLQQLSSSSIASAILLAELRETLEAQQAWENRSQETHFPIAKAIRQSVGQGIMDLAVGGLQKAAQILEARYETTGDSMIGSSFPTTIYDNDYDDDIVG
jgi:hypothetical protein